MHLHICPFSPPAAARAMDPAPREDRPAAQSAPCACAQFSPALRLVRLLPVQMPDLDAANAP